MTSRTPKKSVGHIHKMAVRSSKIGSKNAEEISCMTIPAKVAKSSIGHDVLGDEVIDTSKIKVSMKKYKTKHHQKKAPFDQMDHGSVCSSKNELKEESGENFYVVNETSEVQNRKKKTRSSFRMKSITLQAAPEEFSSKKMLKKDTNVANDDVKENIATSRVETAHKVKGKSKDSNGASKRRKSIKLFSCNRDVVKKCEDKGRDSTLKQNQDAKTGGVLGEVNITKRKGNTRACMASETTLDGKITQDSNTNTPVKPKKKMTDGIKQESTPKIKAFRKPKNLEIQSKNDEETSDVIEKFSKLDTNPARNQETKVDFTRPETPLKGTPKKQAKYCGTPMVPILALRRVSVSYKDPLADINVFDDNVPIKLKPKKLTEKLKGAKRKSKTIIDLENHKWRKTKKRNKRDA